MTTFSFEVDNESDVAKLQAILKAFSVKKLKVEEDEPYNTAFVEKVLESKKQVKAGRVTRVKKENLKELLDL